MSKGILIDLDIMRDSEFIKGKSIILWGAGDKGKYVIKMLKKASIHVSYVCDSNAELWGTAVEGYTVISPFELCKAADKENLCAVLCTAPGSNQTIRKALDYIVDASYEYATYFGIVYMFRFHYETLFQDEAVKYLFRLEKEVGWLEFQQRNLKVLSDVWGVTEGEILLLQPGKVGSSSILVNLLREGCGGYHLHHIHFPANILQEEYRKIWEAALERLRSKKIKLITGVREPIARDISSVFESFNERNNIRRGDWLFKTGDPYKIFEQYTDMILYGNYEPWSSGVPKVWGDEFVWFDQEIQRLWGIDIYQFPFDREKGYSVIRSKGIEIFLYKCEKLDEVSEELYQFALGHAVSCFVSANRADISWRNEAYQKFKRSVVLRPDYVAHYYKDNGKMDHFYTEEEKSGFLKKWEKQIGQKG